MEEVVILKPGKKIIFNGFAYTIHNILSTSILWKCSQRLSKKCPGILITSKGFTNPQLIKDHSHVEDHNLAVVEKAKKDMNNQLKITTNKPSLVFSAVISKLPQNCLKSLSFEESIKRTLRNYRNRGIPPKPNSLAELTIKDEW
ncbi:FLYWCH-type domain-containing protein, partial [Aphis craccivora]